MNKLLTTITLLCISVAANAAEQTTSLRTIFYWLVDFDLNKIPRWFELHQNEITVAFLFILVGSASFLAFHLLYTAFDIDEKKEKIDSFFFNYRRSPKIRLRLIGVSWKLLQLPLSLFGYVLLLVAWVAASFYIAVTASNLFF
ncbi:MAG: hypothetical protein ACJZ79_02080 [Pseudohongiellaceae bacterium]